MRVISLFSLLLVFSFACTSTQVNQTLGAINDALGDGGELSAGQVASGLKEALVKGAGKGTAQASKIDGYFGNPKIKIPFPPKVKKVEDKLRQVGLGKEVDKFVLTLNRGAEEAAKEAKPIFVSAITYMTIQDAWSILKGEKNAATNYLKRVTTTQLKSKFSPIVGKALDKTSATKYYGDLVNTYNKIPFVDKVNPDLNEYATDRAIAGLFQLVEQEEKNIRANPVARTTELLKKVFSQQD